MQRAEALTQTKGGIVIPEKAQAKVLEGTVIAVGPGARNAVSNRSNQQQTNSLIQQVFIFIHITIYGALFLSIIIYFSFAIAGGQTRSIGRESR